MGQHRSARTVYFTLCHQYGAGDYSAVMVIEACLHQLRCWPTRGGVRVADFINTWRTSINQMEAAGFLPSNRQLLSIIADGLLNNTVAFINLFDNIMLSLNDSNDQMLPNIHQLFDRTINIDNTLQHNRILQPSTRRPQQTTPPSTSSTQPPPAATSTAPATDPQNPCPGQTTSTCQCGNCGANNNHTTPTCFQPGGAMEGHREEYLASRPPKPIAHIAEIEENPIDAEEGTQAVVIEDNTLNNEFAAMLLGTTNEIYFSTYVLSSISEILPGHLFAMSSISPNYNSALDSACTNHIFRDREVFHTYNADGAVPVKTALPRNMAPSFWPSGP